MRGCETGPVLHPHFCTFKTFRTYSLRDGVRMETKKQAFHPYRQEARYGRGKNALQYRTN